MALGVAIGGFIGLIVGVILRRRAAPRVAAPKPDGRSRRKQEARSRIEARERLRDHEERFDRDRAAATSKEERHQLAQELTQHRREYRENEGRTATGIAMQQYIWARWLEIAVENELRSRHLLNQMLSDRETNLLLEEYRAGLVAVTSAAFAIEALYNEIEYLIPAQESRGVRHKDLRHAFRVAFGIDQPEDSRLASDLKALFDLRNEAVHAYAEIAPPRPHPAGHNTGAENSLFNGLTAGLAVDLAMRLHTIASAPPNPHSRWIERWSETRTNPDAVAVLRQQRAGADPLSLQQRDLRWPTSP